MNKRSLAGLILINAVLLASLVVTGLSPAPAQAQFGGGGQYLMIAGDVVGRSAQAAVYVVEISSGRVAAIMFNGSNKSLEIIAGRNVAEDANKPTGTR
jgi:hypothetical protein